MDGPPVHLRSAYSCTDWLTLCLECLSGRGGLFLDPGGGCPFYYRLYTDSGKLFSGDGKQTLMTAVARHANQADGADVREVAAARYAAVGDLAAAPVRMVNATPSDFFLSLAVRKKIWQEDAAEHTLDQA